MGRNRRVDGFAASVTMTLACACALSGKAVLLGASPQQNPDNTKTAPTLHTSDLLGILDCATRPDQPLAVKPEFYGVESFALRYLYPVFPGREANALNTFRREHWVALVLFHRDGRSAALFEVGFDGSETNRNFTLLDGANLEEAGGRWELKSILNGGASTWPEIARHVNSLATQRAVQVPRRNVVHTTAVCEFPAHGLEFVAVSRSGDRSDWKFKDGASEGIKFKEQSGPFKNTDLKRTPFDTVFMNSYGPS
jgi:hypothetical protein